MAQHPSQRWMSIPSPWRSKLMRQNITAIRPGQNRWQPLHGPEIDGYSLIELLIAVMIGGLMMIGAASMLIAHMQTSSRSEAMNRLQDSWSRIQFLLDQEIQEAIGTPSVSNCSSLTLTIPTTSGGTDTITYALSGTELQRTGVGVNSDGTLNFGTRRTDLLMSNVTSFCPSISDSEVNYTLALRDVTGVVYQNQSQPSGARSRSRVID